MTMNFRYTNEFRIRMDIIKNESDMNGNSKCETTNGDEFLVYEQISNIQGYTYESDMNDDLKCEMANDDDFWIYEWISNLYGFTNESDMIDDSKIEMWNDGWR